MASFCFVCEEAFVEPERQEVLLPCLHSICAWCKEDIMKLAKEKNQPPCCQRCFEQFSANDVIFAQELKTKQNDSVAFCEQCNACADNTHESTHTLLTLEQASNKIKLEASTQLVLIATQQETLNALLVSLSSRLSSLISEINEAFASLLSGIANNERYSLFEARRDELIKQAKTRVNADIKIVQVQQQTVDMFKEHIENVQCNLEFCLFPFLFTRIHQLQQATATLEPMVKDTLRFQWKQPKNMMTCNISMLGGIGTMRDYRSINQPVRVIEPTGGCIAQLANGNLVISSAKNIQILTLEGACVREFAVLGYAYDIAVSPNGDIWAAFRDPGLLGCYSIDGALLLQVEMSDPVSVAVGNDGRVYATSFDDCYVQSFSPDGLELLKTEGYLQDPSSVTITPDGDLVVVCDKNGIQFFSAVDFSFISILYETFRGETAFSVACIPNTDMIVVCELKSVSICTLSGELIHRWGSQGTQLGQFNEAVNVAVLSDGTIAIAESCNGRIQIF